SLRLGSSVLAHAKGCVIAIALPNVVSPSQSNAKRFCTSRVQWISTDAPGSGDSFGPKVSAYGENCPPNLKFPANGELEVSRMTGVRRIVSHLAQHRDSGLAYSNALFRRYRKERQRSDRRLARVLLGPSRSGLSDLGVSIAAGRLNLRQLRPVRPSYTAPLVDRHPGIVETP